MSEAEPRPPITPETLFGRPQPLRVSGDARKKLHQECETGSYDTAQLHVRIVDEHPGLESLLEEARLAANHLAIIKAFRLIEIEHAEKHLTLPEASEDTYLQTKSEFGNAKTACAWAGEIFVHDQEFASAFDTSSTDEIGFAIRTYKMLQRGRELEDWRAIREEHRAL